MTFFEANDLEEVEGFPIVEKVFYFFLNLTRSPVTFHRRRSGTARSRFLVHPSFHGPERRGCVSHERRSLLASFIARRSPRDALQCTHLEGPTLGTFHLGRSWRGHPLRGCSRRCDVSRQCRTSQVAQEDSGIAHDIVPERIRTSGHGKHSTDQFLLRNPHHVSFLLEFIQNFQKNRFFFSLHNFFEMFENSAQHFILNFYFFRFFFFIIK